MIKNCLFKIKIHLQNFLNVWLKLNFVSYNCLSSYQDNEVFGGTVNFAIRSYGLGDVLHGEGCGGDVGGQLYHQVTFTALKGPTGAWLHLWLSTVTTLYMYQCHTIGKDDNGLFLLSNPFMYIFT